MQEFLLEHYLWLKALHVISIISWMAALLYLPRLFVYHAKMLADREGNASDSDTVQPDDTVFKTMEKRLRGYIMCPAEKAAWIFGLLMIWANPELLSMPWFHVKLLCVVLMSGLNHAFGRWQKAFAEDRNTKSPKFFRVINEMPTLLMIIIVIMVLVKPF